MVYYIIGIIVCFLFLRFLRKKGYIEDGIESFIMTTLLSLFLVGIIIGIIVVAHELDNRGYKINKWL